MLTLPSPFTSPQPPAHANFWMRSLPSLPGESATKAFPLPSTATSMGTLNCPSPLPGLPHLVKKVPLLSNFWMRRLLVSATKTFPLPSTARPIGPSNCSSPLPWLPHLVKKVPLLSNFWMRWLWLSAAKTFPFPSTATPAGPVLNCPSPHPRLPHLVTKGHGSVGSHTHSQEFSPDA